MIVTKKHLPRRTFLRGAMGTMLAMPFLIAGLLGFAIWRASRGPRAPGDGGSPQTLAGPPGPR